MHPHRRSGAGGLFDFEIGLLCEPERPGHEAGGERVDRRVEFADVGVVKPMRNFMLMLVATPMLSAVPIAMPPSAKWPNTVP